MAQKLFNDTLAIEYINKVLQSSGVAVRKFKANTQMYPVDVMSNTDVSIDGFDGGTDSSIQTITVQIVSRNPSLNDKKVAVEQDTMFKNIHQNLDSFNALTSDWRFLSVTCDNFNTTQIYEANNPGTAGTMNVRIVCEYVGN